MTLFGVGVRNRTAETEHSPADARNNASWIFLLAWARCHQNDLPLHAYLFIVLKLRAQ